jgi:osmoprotectant transport system ATP-binding protein
MSDPTPSPVIAFDHVSYRVASGRTLLSDLTLNIGAGETLVLLGRSGCGKTTTMRLINRLLDPTSGQVRIDGIATTDWDPYQLRRRIGYVIQEAGLFPHYTIEANVALVPRLLKWPEDRIKTRVAEMLELVGLSVNEFAHRFPHELSGGQRQRVGIARALAADPPIMLLDEPFSALDPITRRSIQLEFKQLQQRLGKTMVFVTHDVREAFILATRIGLLKDGRMAFLGRPADFLTSEDPEAIAFVQCLEDPSTLVTAP